MPRRASHSKAASPPLNGLVVAGGRGTRLGRDKGSLDYHGVSQARWAFELLSGFCSTVYVSVRRSQADNAPYVELPLITDADDEATGPAAGLIAAFRTAPSVAWLLLAADMPLVDAAMLRRLKDERDPTCLATAYRHSDGVPEPLCAIWEPASRSALDRGHSKAELISLRRLLERGPAQLIEPADATRLRSVNFATDDAEVSARLRSKDRAPPGENDR